jgi:N-acyl-D-aspartate/D-glutamate deacylase
MSEYPQMADFAIRNALIVDGTGKPGFYGSVAVKGDKIVEV